MNSDKNTPPSTNSSESMKSHNQQNASHPNKSEDSSSSEENSLPPEIIELHQYFRKAFQGLKTRKQTKEDMEFQEYMNAMETITEGMSRKEEKKFLNEMEKETWGEKPRGNNGVSEKSSSAEAKTQLNAETVLNHWINSSGKV